MEGARFLRIRYRDCGTTTTILADRRAPVSCVRCRAPYDAASASFQLRSSADSDDLVNSAGPVSPPAPAAG